MKYFFRLLFIVSWAFGLSACTEILVHDVPETGEVPFRVTISMADRDIQTKSKVSGNESHVHTMQLVCFDANGQYLGIRKADVQSKGASGTFFDTGTISGTVPQYTARIHFIANRNLNPSLSFPVGTAEYDVMHSMELSTFYRDTTIVNVIEGEPYQEICYWGYHKEDDAEAMIGWLTPEEGDNHEVFMIRDRAKVILKYDPAGATVPVTKIEWLIHNGRERGYLAPDSSFWSNNNYYRDTTIGERNYKLSKAKIHEYTTCNRYSLYRNASDNDSTRFDVAYISSSGNTLNAQYLFDDDNEAVDNLKVILRVTYTVNNNSVIRYHVLRLNDDNEVLYNIVRNNTYYINCKLLNPEVAFYVSLEQAINGDEFVNAETEVDRTIPDINNDKYTLQIKLPNEGTSIVLNTEDSHPMDFVFRYVDSIDTTPRDIFIDPDNENYNIKNGIFEVKWEKTQTFCESSLPLTYNPTTKQFTITATVLEGQLTNILQDEWIVVKHIPSGLTRYIHVFVIDQFRYKLYPTLKKAGNDYVLSFELPPMEHTQFLPDGSGDPNELIYPESLYPIEVKFTTNTLNAYGTTQGTTNYGLFGVSVDSTSHLTNVLNFEEGDDEHGYYNDPVSSTLTSDMNRWFFQQADNYWDFWYTYTLKTYPTANSGVVNIYFKDVRNHITYASVVDVGLFLYVEYFGKNYSVPVTE